VNGIADRAGLAPDAARRALEAVLETLAERIAGGEVDDLIVLLPGELRPALERGRRNSGGNPVRMSLDEFVDRVATREGVPVLVAREHTAAVLATFGEVLPDAEWRDVWAQLPSDYKTLA
jgi:uncharacterized protein (DUF2267 family)